jgi:hypothetical protein
MDLFQKLLGEIQESERRWNEVFYLRYHLARQLIDEETGVFRAYLPHKQTGTMAMSVTLNYPLFRWHESKYLWRGDEIHKSFLDGRWKLSAQGRFAGRSLNCGHYFALSAHAATAERITYAMSDYDVLLCADAVLPDILDLTHADNIEKVFARLIEDGLVEDYGISSKPWEMIYFLMDKELGGNWLTDFVGHWAAEEGYSGVLFFSSRAASLYRENCFRNRNANLAGLDFRENLYTMRLDRNAYCVVVFSGAMFLDRCRKISVKKMDGTEETFLNRLFDRGIEQIRSLSDDFGEITQRVAFVRFKK